jgi:hypothetical protein
LVGRFKMTHLLRLSVYWPPAPRAPHRARSCRGRTGADSAAGRQANPFGHPGRWSSAGICRPGTLRLASSAVGNCGLDASANSPMRGWRRSSVATPSQRRRPAGVKFLVWNARDRCRRRIPAWQSSTPPSLRRALSGPPEYRRGGGISVRPTLYMEN